MYKEIQPLYTLTIGEYVALTKKIVEETIKEKFNQNSSSQNLKEDDETFNIVELAKFLRCSKVSIHKYKKKGLPFYRIGRKILFKKNEVLNFMNSLKGKRLFT